MRANRDPGPWIEKHYEHGTPDEAKDKQHTTKSGEVWTRVKCLKPECETCKQPTVWLNEGGINLWRARTALRRVAAAADLRRLSA